MSDCIEREAALDAISEWLMKALHPENMSSYNEGERAAYRTALSEIAELPAADVRPVVLAHWVEIKTNVGTPNVCYFSSCCSFPSWYGKLNFCPNCGADMREES